MAVLSRTPAEADTRGLPGREDDGARLLRVRVAGLDFAEVLPVGLPGRRVPPRHGLRIDLVLGAPAVAARVRRVEIDREYCKKKDGRTASDHAPVFADLD